MLEEWGPSLWIAEGPTVSFLTFPYPTRMVVARLSDGSAWAWSPIALTSGLADAVDAIGPLRAIVAPNKLHHLFLKEWADRWPEARIHAAPGLAERRPDLAFASTLGDEPDPAWADDFDQALFRGSFAMEEVVFFHRPSKTAIVCDLVQRHDPTTARGLKGLIMRLDGLVGDNGSTPREWRASFLRRGPAREARDRVLAWKPEGLIIAHGACSKTNATAILERALYWI